MILNDEKIHHKFYFITGNAHILENVFWSWPPTSSVQQLAINAGDDLLYARDDCRSFHLATGLS